MVDGLDVKILEIQVYYIHYDRKRVSLECWKWEGISKIISDCLEGSSLIIDLYKIVDSLLLLIL